MPRSSADPPGSRVLVFDLDDTLYLERDFALSGFAAASKYLESTAGVAGLDECCKRLFDEGVRGQIFDRALRELGHAGHDRLVQDLVEIYRGHEPDIAIAEDVKKYLQKGPGKRALITDGPEKTQRSKIEALGLAPYFGLIVTTGSWPQGFGKPHPRAFETVMSWSGQPPFEHVYIADNPAKDFLAPRALGWRTVQIDRVGRVHAPDPKTPAHAADGRITSLAELDELLATDLSGLPASR